MAQDSGPASVPRRVRRALGQAAWRVSVSVRPGPRLPEWSGPATTLPPILVAGTGRSGTTVTARLLGLHSTYYLIPFEVKFLADSGGLTDVIAGQTSVRAFERKLLGPWFDRTEGRGLHQITDRDTIRAAVRELYADMGTDRILAARRFTHRLLDPPAIAAGAHGWIENTPNTIREAPTIRLILPEARFVHMVRDGRDVACSLTRRAWGPDDADEGLRWWARHLERSFHQAAAAPAGIVHEVRMEALVRYDRAASYQAMLAFLGLGDEPAIGDYFDAKVEGDHAHIGRWRKDVPAEAQEGFLATYRAASAPLVERWGYDADLTDREHAPVRAPG